MELKGGRGRGEGEEEVKRRRWKREVNVHSQLQTRNQYNVVYKFTCNFGECKSLQNAYIGMKPQTLAKHLNKHRNKGFMYRVT